MQGYKVNHSQSQNFGSKGKYETMRSKLRYKEPYSQELNPLVLFAKEAKNEAGSLAGNGRTVNKIFELKTD